MSKIIGIILSPFLRIIWKNFLYRVVFRTNQNEGEYFRNQFGSIISPLEFKISWDSNLTERAILLKELVKPVNEKGGGSKLVRLGSSGDGGYFLPETYTNCDGAISGGISDNNDFEYALAITGIPVVQFDHTIDAPPKESKLLYFKKEKLGFGGVSLSHTLAEFKELTGKELKNGILKLDIEGSEFDFLGESDTETLSRFDIIVIELHFLGSIYKDLFWKKVCDSLNLINQSHKSIIAIGNNSRPYVQIGGVPICDIIEITFIRKNAAVPIFDKLKVLTTQVETRAPLRLF